MTTRIVTSGSDETYSYAVGAFAAFIRNLPWKDVEKLAQEIELQRSKGKSDCQRRINGDILFRALSSFKEKNQ